MIRKALRIYVRYLEAAAFIRNIYTGFYCIGATTFFLNKLSEGSIDAIATLNEYDEGYSAVEMLMADLKKTNYMTNIDMENMLVDKESLENDDIIKRLFPID